MLGGKTKPKHALRSLTGANMFYMALGTQICKMLSEGFMVPTSQCWVPSNSILQKPLSLSQDLVLQAMLITYTFHVLMDFILLLKGLLLTFHPNVHLFILLHSLLQLGLLQVFYIEFC